MRSSSVSITGISIASALGRRWHDLGEAILRHQSGLHKSHRYAEWIAAPLGELPLDDWQVPTADRLKSDRVMRRVMLGMIDQLAADTQVFQRYRPRDIGLFLGTTTCGIDGFFAALAQHRTTQLPLLEFLSPDMQQVWITQEMRAAFPLRGPQFTFSSSCAAAAQAIGQAYDAVRSGICPVAIAGGIDILNRVTLHGFDSLQILDHDFCQPFAPNRKGINLGEGGALLLLEGQPQGEVIASVRGYAALSEAHHMVQPAPHGIWMQRTMDMALQNANWQPDRVDYINAHGTGTEGNDAAEGEAVSQLFGNLDRLHATKGLTGHYLGAAGALEAAITVAMLKKKGLKKGLSNSFGFGGSNISLLFATDS
ncbi:MAG TPA: beta-ketoacyl synthase N-terminal-like domain-containing protein [Oligoflexus sp.]|uniref:beta-ketoacyl synthase N-terminal-like domain-containing protein n=1 Tax=Oligoflexus sp. TaxID=1971216 RepID=UPI002D647AF6|nr:beta-ketoacyl synthase N-terminal-like domain-containing protein [Oligoflexus sp.]HYX36051.1 beta-ketoacyl synthase N-terminal-like domain-containing protein [Oligoflexus sp.]